MPLSTACSVVLFVGAPGDFFGGKGVFFFRGYVGLHGFFMGFVFVIQV